MNLEFDCDDRLAGYYNILSWSEAMTIGREAIKMGRKRYFSFLLLFLTLRQPLYSKLLSNTGFGKNKLAI